MHPGCQIEQRKRTANTPRRHDCQGGKSSELRWAGLPAVRQQFFDLAILVCGQVSQHIPQVGIRIMSIELGALDQTHHRSSALPGPQSTCKQPVFSANDNWTNLVLNPVVVDGQLPIIQKLRQSSPALQAVVQCFGCGRSICNL